MRAEQQYIDLFSQCEAMICRHSAEVLNAPREQAFAMIRGLLRGNIYHPGGRLYYLHMLEKLHEDLQLIVFVKSRLRSAWMGMLLTFVVKWMN